MNRNNILLIIIGVIGLGISLFYVAGAATLLIAPGSRDNLEHIQEMIDIAGWSSIFFAAMTVLGIGLTVYNNWRR